MKSTRETFHEHYSELMKPVKSQADAELELRGREMAEDPMLEYFREKEREKHGNKGKPTYKNPYPPNRYNIRPGYRWDGVDRSNGHEKKLMDKQVDKKASEEEVYRQATRDL